MFVCVFICVLFLKVRHPVKVGILWNMRGRVQLTWQMNLSHGGRENMMVLKLSIGLRLTYGPLNFFFQMDEKCKSFWMDGWLQRSCLRVLLVVPDKNKQTNNKNSNLTT